MKNKFALILILTVLLIAVTINVALSIAVPDLMFATNGFTVAWVFTFPVNLVLTISTILYVLAKNKDFAVRFPPVLCGSCLFSAVYFVVGSIIMFTATENSGTPLVIELLITVAYVVYLLIVGFGIGYIESAQRYTKRKVQYLGLLEADVKSAIPFVTNQATRDRLVALAEKIRFSDPMSHESLADHEEQISCAVKNLIISLRTAPDVDMSAEFIQIEAMIEYRNDRCKLLK